MCALVNDDISIQSIVLRQGVRNLKFFETCGLKILSLNINRLLNKLTRLEYFLSEINVNPDIIILSETWATPDTVQYLNVDGFNSFHYVRNNNGGGVSILVRLSLAAEYFGNDFLDGVCDLNNEFLLVKLTDSKNLIGATYRRPSSSISAYLEKLDSVLCKYNDLILGGDTNIDLLLDSPSKSHLLSILNCNGFHLLNPIDRQFYTRKSHNSTITIIDHLFTNIKLSNAKFLVGDNELSDHRYLITGFNLEDPLTHKSPKVKFQKVDFDKVSKNLGDLQDLDFDSFHDTLRKLIKDNTKTIEFSSKKHEFKNISSAALKQYKSSRDKFYSLMKKYPNIPEFKQKFIYFRNSFKKELYHLRQAYYSKLLSDNISNPSKTWKTIHKIVYNKEKEKGSSVSDLLIDGRLLREDLEKAEALNSFFAGNNPDPESDSVGDDSINANIQAFTVFQSTNPGEILEIISSLKVSASSGYDGIPARFVKSNSLFFANYLSKEFNKAFNTGIFPKTLKISRITPIFKSGSKRESTNYRPISILSVFSKILEKLMLGRLSSFLIERKIIHENQFGFLKGSSTSAATTNLVNKIVTNINTKQKTAAIFIDLSKAFDTLSFEILRKILVSLGINGLALHLLMSFLSRRKQYVRIGDAESSFRDIHKGVPQGSILGPVLFLLYLNGIFSLSLRSHLQCYADDMALVLAEDTIELLKDAIVSDMRRIIEFLKTLNMTINFSKTKYMIFKRHYRNALSLFSTVQIYSQTVESCEVYDYLGLTIDSRLTWAQHIQRVCSKVSSHVFAISKLRYYVSPIVLKMYYSSFVHSQVIYLLPVWGSAAKTHLLPLQYLQNKTQKIMKFLPYDYPTINLYSPQILSINQQFKFESLLLIYKVINNLIKSNITFVRNTDVSGRTTRAAHLWRLPSFRTEIAQKSVFFLGLSMFNELPNNLKELNSITAFKSQLKEYVYQKFNTI